MPRCHLLFDTALNGAAMLLHMQAAFPVHESLFHKTPDSHLIAVAPFLFQTTEAWPEILSQHRIQPRAIVVLESWQEAEQLADHLRQYIIRSTNGKSRYFRCWDARVLDRHFLRWQPAQATAFFGDAAAISTYPALPDEGGTHYTLLQGTVQAKMITGKTGREIPMTTPATTNNTHAPQDLSTPKKQRTFLA